ncbi:MAG: methyltransferase domain-containing protein [Planctomycetes bacterium]|nr:methyltransferase domain-containing protein [Planctomycetota bacterium]MCH9034949.1 methyltransferase domain-containing protein [Planctomycetota bacterium]
MPVADYHAQFASVFDTIYQDRDVAAESRSCMKLLQLDGARGRGAHVLDFGCGTGSHVFAFAETGLAATGFDVSAAMIAQARKKTPSAGSAPVHFESGNFSDFRRQQNGTKFSGAVSLFNVFNCMPTPAAMLSHLRLIRDGLAPGARFVVDVWNGAAVFADEPRPSVRHFSQEKRPDHELVRITVPKLDRIEQVCELHYRVLTLNRAAGSFTEFESVHTLRFLTPVQYRHLFEMGGLAIVDEFVHGRPGTPVTEHDWYISYLLRNDDSSAPKT